MNNIDYDMELFCSELTKALNYFELLQKKEKEVDFKIVKRFISSIENKRQELKIKYPSEMLDNNSQKVRLITKQINNTLDNVVKITKIEKDLVGLELSKLNNKKKIATYIR